MNGYLSDWQVGQLINWLVTQDFYVSLHHTTIDQGDPTASEVPGASYRRAKTGFGALGARAMVNLATLNWTGMDPTAITHLGIFDAAVGGHLRGVCPLALPVVVSAGVGFSWPTGELVWSW